MNADYWHDIWEAQQIRFHQRDVNLLLVTHFAALDLTAGARVFVPLCGKTCDIAWLMGQGCRVAGAELSEIAVQQLFAEMDVTPEISDVGTLKRYASEGIDIYVGDIFDLTADILGPVDAVFDRAALVALPADMRARYAAHLVATTKTAKQLVVTFTYDQALMDGPPFSVSTDNMQELYDGSYKFTNLHTDKIAGGFKDGVPATETAWLLTQKGGA